MTGQITRVTIHHLTLAHRIDGQFEIGMDFQLPDDANEFRTGTAFFHVPAYALGDILGRILWTIEAESCKLIEGPRPCRMRITECGDVEAILPHLSNATLVDLRRYLPRHV